MEREEIKKMIDKACENLAHKHWMHIQKLQSEVNKLQAESSAYRTAIFSNPEMKEAASAELDRAYKHIAAMEERRAFDANPSNRGKKFNG